MDFRGQIFCCPSINQCGQTPASLGLKLEPFMDWARPKTAPQGSTNSADYINDLLIEVVLTNADKPLPPASMFFIIGKDQDGPNTYRELPAMRALHMELHVPAEECRILVCSNCQLSYTVSLYKKRPQQAHSSLNTSSDRELEGLGISNANLEAL